MQTGQVFVHGEYWNARSDQPIAKGERVKVAGSRGTEAQR